MNRRSFLGSLLALPLALKAVPKPASFIITLPHAKEGIIQLIDDGTYRETWYKDGSYSMTYKAP